MPMLAATASNQSNNSIRPLAATIIFAMSSSPPFIIHGSRENKTIIVKRAYKESVGLWFRFMQVQGSLRETFL